MSKCASQISASQQGKRGKEPEQKVGKGNWQPKIPWARNTNPRIWRSVHHSQSDAIAKMQGKETIKSSFERNGTLCLCSLTTSTCCEQHVQNNSSHSLGTAGKAFIKPNAWQSWSPPHACCCLLASLPPGWAQANRNAPTSGKGWGALGSQGCFALVFLPPPYLVYAGRHVSIHRLSMKVRATDLRQAGKAGGKACKAPTLP